MSDHQPPRKLSAFLCHSSGDKPAVRALYQRLKESGIEPWLDEEKLLPGQEWPREILKAVRSSDVVIVCLSRASIIKRGYVQKEITFALDAAQEQPEDRIFIIPAKLEECEVPNRLRHLHWVNLYHESGYALLLRALQKVAEQLQEEGVQPDTIPSTKLPPPQENLSRLLARSAAQMQEDQRAKHVVAGNTRLRTIIIMTIISVFVILGVVWISTQRGWFSLRQQAPATATTQQALRTTVVVQAPTQTTTSLMTVTPLATATFISPTAASTSTPLLTDEYLRDNNCITDVWQSYTYLGRRNTADNCWSLSFPPSYWRFNDKHLVLANQPAFYDEQDTAQSHNELGAMVAPIPSITVVEFDVTIHQLEVSSVQFGVEPRDTPGTTKAVLLMLVNLNKTSDGVIAIFQNEKLDGPSIRFRTGDTIHVRLEIYDVSMTIYINDKRLSQPIILPSGENNLWIGYSLHPNKPVNVIISNIMISK